MTDFPPHSAAVLVHGAWADGSCWDNVVLPLQRAGLRVICAPKGTILELFSAISWRLCHRLRSLQALACSVFEAMHALDAFRFNFAGG